MSLRSSSAAADGDLAVAAMHGAAKSADLPAGFVGAGQQAASAVAAQLMSMA